MMKLGQRSKKTRKMILFIFILILVTTITFLILSKFAEYGYIENIGDTKFSSTPSKINPTTKPGIGLKDGLFYIVPVNENMMGLINMNELYSIKYPRTYKDECWKSSGCQLVLYNNSEYFYERAGNIIINSGTNSEYSDNSFKKVFTNANGYRIEQSLYVNESNHPQGLGTVYTIVKNENRSVTIMTFIGGFLEDIAKGRSVNDLTKADYLRILDEMLPGYQIVVDSIKFLP